MAQSGKALTNVFDILGRLLNYADCHSSAQYSDYMYRFFSREGHCLTPFNLVINGQKLGVWVSNLRQTKDQLSSDRVKRLNSIGFNWDPYEEQWNKNFAALKKFREKEGHFQMPDGLVFDGLKLSIWVTMQRSRKNRLTPSQISQLDSLGFNWDPRTDQWEQHFIALKKFNEREGHSRVNKTYSEDGLHLGRWVKWQRNQKDKITAERLRRLNSMGFIWDARLSLWEESFNALKNFHKREGHSRIPQSHKEHDLKLGTWASNQRRSKNQLSRDQIRKLDSLKFTWDPRADDWEEAFESLKKFKNREGHFRVNHSHMEGNVKLGRWVNAQRQKKAGLTPERQMRLNALGFIWKALK